MVQRGFSPPTARRLRVFYSKIIGTLNAKVEKYSVVGTHEIRVSILEKMVTMHIVRPPSAKADVVEVEAARQAKNNNNDNEIVEVEGFTHVYACVYFCTSICEFAGVLSFSDVK